jgi:hypothetical protein
MYIVCSYLCTRELSLNPLESSISNSYLLRDLLVPRSRRDSGVSKLANATTRHIFFNSTFTRNPSVDVCQRLDHPRNTLSTIPMAPIRPGCEFAHPFELTLEDSVSSLSGSNSLAEPVSCPDLVPELRFYI